MTKNWICTICHRHGEKTIRPEAEKEHRELLLNDAQSNRIMTRKHPGFVGPKTQCVGNIVLRSCLTVAGKPTAVSGVLGGDEPWI